MGSAEDIAATLRYVVPGFVALSVFDWFGLRTKPTDLRLTLWSLVAAAFIDALVSFTNPPTPDLRVLMGLATGVLLGSLLSLGWQRYGARARTLTARLSPTAWDQVLDGGLWVNVWTKSGDVIFGTPRVVALSTESEDLDLFLEQPAWVDAETGERHAKPETAGVLIRREDVQLLEVFAPTDGDI